MGAPTIKLTVRIYKMKSTYPSALKRSLPCLTIEPHCHMVAGDHVLKYKYNRKLDGTKDIALHS